MQTSLIIGIFNDDDKKGQEWLQKLKSLPDDAPIQVHSAVSVRMDEDKKTHVEDIHGDSKAPKWGAVTGAAIGLLAGPGGAIVGGLIGAGLGKGVASISDYGVSKGMIEDIEAGLQPGSSAIIIYAEPQWTDRLANDLQEDGADVSYDALNQDITEAGAHPKFSQ